MFFGLLIVVHTAVMLIVGIGGLTLLTLGFSKRFPKKYQAGVMVGACIFPFAYYGLGQWRLGAICEANARPVIMEKRRDVEGFYFRKPATYGFDARPALWVGFSYAEQEGNDRQHRFRKSIGKNEDESIYSNQLSSADDFIISSPTLHNPLLSIYRQEMAVIERSTDRVLGHSTDYLWGAPDGTVRAWYVKLFLGRSFMSCGPGLRKGLANDSIEGQRRQDEYQGRDVQFLESVLRSSS